VLFLELIDGIQAVCSGVLRGCGFQAFGGICNVVFYYFVGVPLAAVMVFVYGRSLTFIYLGFSVGVLFQAVAFVARIGFTDLKGLSAAVVRRERNAAQRAAVAVAGALTQVPTAEEETEGTRGAIVLQSPSDVLETIAEDAVPLVAAKDVVDADAKPQATTPPTMEVTQTDH